MLSEYKSNLSLKSINDAEQEAKTLLESTQKKLGFIPNMYFAMANSPGLLNTYMQGYSAFREKSGFSPIEQEVVFLAISQANGCEYCMAAHSFLAEAASGVPSDVTAAIRDGRQVPEMHLNALSVFARLMVITRGLPSQTEVDAFISAGYSDEHILEIIHAVAIKTISNYTNHIFHTEVDNIFSPHEWSGKNTTIKSVA